MKTSEATDILLDPAIRDWVLIPIMLIMVLVGMLRHYLTLIMQPSVHLNLKAVRENQALMKIRLLRTSTSQLILPTSRLSRIQYFIQEIEKDAFLKNKDAKVGVTGAPNPLTDPEGMERMMDGLKGNMLMVIPQTILMSWINLFFAGFVIIKLPFPLTSQFKAMLQRGIETPDMDVTWVSSLSWYFLNLFGLQGIFRLLLGTNDANDALKQMTAFNPAAGAGQPGQPQVDMKSVFQGEKEALKMISSSISLSANDLHSSMHVAFSLADVEQRLVQKWRKQQPVQSLDQKKRM